MSTTASLARTKVRRSRSRALMPHMRTSPAPRIIPAGAAAVSTIVCKSPRASHANQWNLIPSAVPLGKLVTAFRLAHLSDLQLPPPPLPFRWRDVASKRLLSRFAWRRKQHRHIQSVLGRDRRRRGRPRPRSCGHNGRCHQLRDARRIRGGARLAGDAWRPGRRHRQPRQPRRPERGRGAQVLRAVGAVARRRSGRRLSLPAGSRPRGADQPVLGPAHRAAPGAGRPGGGANRGGARPVAGDRRAGPVPRGADPPSRRALASSPAARN